MKTICFLLLAFPTISALHAQQPTIHNVNLQYTTYIPPNLGPGPIWLSQFSTGDPHAECFINIQGIITTNSNYWFYGQTLAVPENELNKTVSIYPNPTADNIFIVPGFENTKGIVVELLSTTGAVVYKGNWAENNGTIGLSNLPAGLYIGRLTRNNSTLKTFKITKL